MTRINTAIVKHLVTVVAGSAAILTISIIADKKAPSHINALVQVAAVIGEVALTVYAVNNSMKLAGNLVAVQEFDNVTDVKF